MDKSGGCSDCPPGDEDQHGHDTESAREEERVKEWVAAVEKDREDLKEQLEQQLRIELEANSRFAGSTPEKGWGVQRSGDAAREYSLCEQLPAGAFPHVSMLGKVYGRTFGKTTALPRFRRRIGCYWLTS